MITLCQFFSKTTVINSDRTQISETSWLTAQQLSDDLTLRRQKEN